jgi:starvation-inducible DNA-binding protein
MATAKEATALRVARLDTPTDLRPDAVPEISGALNILLADMFALYLKTKNFHWHMSGPHFRDYHLLLDEQGEQIFATTDDIAERARKIGRTTLRRSAISAGCSACSTTTRTSSRRSICSRSCAMTTSSW